MLTPADFQLDTVISFNLYPAAILGASVSRVKVTDILSYDTARMYVNDLQAIHASIFPYLPVGTPNDPTKYKYIKVVLPDGTAYAYGIPWIVDNSVSVYSGTSMQLTIDDVSPEDQSEILAILSAAGFTSIKTDFLTTAGTSGASSGASA